MCEQVGPEITAAVVLLQLKSFFDEVAFAYEHSLGIPDVHYANAKDTSTDSERVPIVYVLNSVLKSYI